MLRIFSVILGCVSFFGALSQTPRGKLFIIGGGSRTESMMARLIDESGLRNGGYAIVLPMSSAEPDSSVYYASEPFHKAGIATIYGLHFSKGDAFPAARIDSIRKAKLVYISGGDQARFMEAIEGSAVGAAILDGYNGGSIIAGTSAGAAVMCSIMITGNAKRYPQYASTFKTIESNNLETQPGLGLIQHVMLDQHFLIRSRHSRLLTAVIDYPAMKGIGIDESTAILVSGNTAEVIGESQVVVFENPGKSRSEKDGKLGAKGIVVSIYLPGEIFKIK